MNCLSVLFLIVVIAIEVQAQDYRGCQIKDRWVQVQDACDDHELCSLSCDCNWLFRDSYTIKCWEPYNGGFRETTKRERFSGGGGITSLTGGTETCFDEVVNGSVQTVCRTVGGSSRLQCSCT